MGRTKCVVIREELVALTGDYKRAIVLGQIMYWSERVRDRDAFVEEENKRSAGQSSSTSHGWFYKRAEDLSEETMMGVKPKAMREYIKHLVEYGWVFEQRNVDKLDRTLQYRVNLVKIHQDLLELGYTLARCTTYPSLPIDEKETTRDEKEKGGSNKEGTTPLKRPSNIPKEASATSGRENTTTPKSLAVQGFQVTDLTPEINTQRLQDLEITHTDYEDVVCARIVELFGKKLARSKVRALINLARQEEVDLEHVIENTYQYHTNVEKCRSIFGSLHYAIENGGWEMIQSSPPKRTSKPLPKAVQAQLDRKNEPARVLSDSESIALKIRMRKKIEELGYVYNEELDKWEDTLLDVAE